MNLPRSVRPFARLDTLVLACMVYADTKAGPHETFFRVSFDVLFLLTGYLFARLLFAEARRDHLGDVVAFEQRRGTILRGLSEERVEVARQLAQLAALRTLVRARTRGEEEQGLNELAAAMSCRFDAAKQAQTSSGRDPDGASSGASVDRADPRDREAPASTPRPSRDDD